MAIGLNGGKGGKFVGHVTKYYRSSVERSKGVTIDRGGYLMIEIEWSDAPALFAKNCVGKKDNFDVFEFLEDYKILKVQRIE